VVDPRKQISVGDRALAALVLSGTAGQRRLAREQRLFELQPLGSGSDYTPFLQHLGISSLNVGFGGEGDYGQYHSIYDSFDHFVRFMDPDFSYGLALSKVAGRLVLRLAEADVLPFEFTRFAAALSGYVSELEDLADTMRADTVERNRRLDDRVYEAVENPYESWLPPARLDPVPHLNFAPLKNAASAVAEAAQRFDRALKPALESGRISPDVRTRLDAILMKCERALTRPEGLPNRSWFRHQVYAPGFYTGYGVKTLPAVREAIEQRQWREAEERALTVGETIRRFAAEIDRAATLLGQ
jgi:N-acetylated-alpha-linked acidic dipeptidase